MLLAKSQQSGHPPKTLAEHSRDVADAFVALFGNAEHPSRLGRQWLRFFQLLDSHYPALYANGVAACGLHDLGKANDGFQNAVKKKGEQLLRHEHLSVLILLLPGFGDWLQNHPCIDVDIVLSAVVGHHLKAAKEGKHDYPLFAEGLPGTSSQSCIVHADHPEFQAVLDTIAERLGLAHFTASVPAYWGLYDQMLTELKENLVKRFRRFHKELKQDPPRLALLLAVKAAVIVADAAGSALVRENKSITDWIAEAFSEQQLITGAKIDGDIVQPRITAIEARKRETNADYRFKFQSFQDEAAKLPERALMLAGCGAGKTLAAWRWIQARLDERPAARVLFLYPTRATSTEGFRDYVSYAPESDAALLTGTANYDLQDMFANPDDERLGSAYLTERRLYALGFWQKRVFSATVDQFLGFLQQSYGSLCLLPVLADSVVVIDEVHSFNVALWSALKTFLKAFNVPTLCMTASLPSRRRAELAALGLQVFPGESHEFEDLQRRARLPRYHVQRIAGDEHAETIAREAVAAGKRVLWVVNTVDRCQTLARRLENLQPLCYHSRFRLADRKTRHQKVIEAFQPPLPSGVIAITTQVCEMSLDLDAQVLISEYAPIPSLIQRMGRCNRHAENEDSPLGEVWLYPPQDNRPYDKEDLKTTPDFIAALEDEPASQDKLEELLERYTANAASEGDRLIAFISDGPWARGGAEELRDSLDHTVQAVLSTDVEHYLKLKRWGKVEAEGFILPAPRYPRELAQPDARLGSGLRVAPASHYHKHYGLCKEPQIREAFIV